MIILFTKRFICINKVTQTKLVKICANNVLFQVTKWSHKRRLLSMLYFCLSMSHADWVSSYIEIEEYLVRKLWVGWMGVLKSPITISFSELDPQFIVIKILSNRSSSYYELSQNIYSIDLYKAVMSILILVFPEDLQKGV